MHTSHTHSALYLNGRSKKREGATIAESIFAVDGTWKCPAYTGGVSRRRAATRPGFRHSSSTLGARIGFGPVCRRFARDSVLFTDYPACPPFARSFFYFFPSAARWTDRRARCQPRSVSYLASRTSVRAGKPTEKNGRDIERYAARYRSGNSSIFWSLRRARGRLAAAEPRGRCESIEEILRSWDAGNALLYARLNDSDSAEGLNEKSE